MSPSEQAASRDTGAAPPVALTLYCDNPAAELLVVNHEFRLVAQGSAPLRASVAPGIYALKAKIGSQISERLETIDGAEQARSFTLTPPQFESPMPLRETTTSREYHEGSLAAFTGLGATRIDIGTGTGFVLYVRDTSRTNFEVAPEHRAEYADCFQGFRLLDRAGQVLVDFDAQATKHIDAGYIGAHVRLNPGDYVLAWENEGELSCLALHMTAGWALQAFIRLQPRPGAEPRMRPDFSEAAFALDRLETSYSASRDDYRAMEAARLALFEHRNLSGDRLREILDGKYQNPMLGIYGAHLLAGRADVPLDQLGQVIANTAGLVGPGNPDIVALAWLYERASHKRPNGFDQRPWQEVLAALSGPPLLVPSWDALLACVEAERIDITGMPAFRVAGVLAPSGIWLMWKQPPSIAPIAAPARATVEVAAAPTAQPAAPAPAGAGAGRGFLGGLLTRLWQGLGQAVLGRRADGTPAPLPTLDVKIAELTTPAAAAEVMQRLARKARWDKLIRLAYKDPARLEEAAGTFTPLQRDLLLTLARSSVAPETIEGINAEYISSVMRAHRVPLATVASAMRGLDIVAVSVDVIGRISAALAASSASAPAGKG